MKLIIGLLLTGLSLNVSSQNTILWSVKDTSNNKTSYLLGTYHQMGNSFVDSIPQIQEALLSSNLSIFESLDNGAKVRAYLNQRSEDSTYLNELKKSDLEFLESFASDWGVPVSKLSPMELLTKLQQKYFETQCGTIKPTDTWTQFDEYLIHLSKINNIKLLGLENDSIQTANINQMKPSGGWDNVKKPIHEWIENIKKSKNTNKYCTAAQNYMKLSFNYQFDVKCGENPMLKGRNNIWMKSIPTYLNNNNCFIAVGIMHLYGECGLIEQLRKQGLNVSEINLKN